MWKYYILLYCLCCFPIFNSLFNSLKAIMHNILYDVHLTLDVLIFTRRISLFTMSSIRVNGCIMRDISDYNLRYTTSFKAVDKNKEHILKPLSKANFNLLWRPGSLYFHWLIWRLIIRHWKDFYISTIISFSDFKSLPLLKWEFSARHV